MVGEPLPRHRYHDDCASAFLYLAGTVNISQTSRDSCFDPEAPINQEIFKLLRWTLLAVNTYYRVLYRGGVFLPRSEAVTAVECGWKMLDPRIIYKQYDPQVCFLDRFSFIHSVSLSHLELVWQTPIKEGYHHLARMSAERQWCLFRLRPKMHLQAHLVFLLCISGSLYRSIEH